MPAEYEVIALRYGTLQTTRSQMFYRYHAYGDPDTAIQMDYYFWVIRNDEETILLDTGFLPEAGTRRGRTCLIDPVVALETIGIGIDDVSRIILSHFHYDHTGNVSRSPVRRSLRNSVRWSSGCRRWRGGSPSRARANRASSTTSTRHRSRGASRRSTVTGARARDHRPPRRRPLSGQQIITVNTASGPVVLASDALHLYEELERDRPFEVFCDLPATFAAYDTLAVLEADGGAIVAGHDPAVMTRFAPFSPETTELAVRIG